MTSSSSSTDILIIGAGPTGLMLACQLSLYPNISFRIIDKNSSRNIHSRALVVHARSLELFAQLNLVEKAITQGEFVNGGNIFIRGKCRSSLNMKSIQTDQQSLLTRYPYILFLEQSVTEQLLETYLNEHNIHVERQTEAIDFIDIDSKNDNEVQVILSTGEIIRTKYVCACDGARSIVRHKLNLSFDGRTYSESIFVADCKIDNIPFGKNQLTLFFASSGLSGIFPMTHDRYRIVGTIHEQKETDQTISIEEAANILKQRSEHFDMNIHDCSWISVYRSHHRHITTFRYRNRYFLLGDAAHIHSPVGGQGMNTGLQDAHNLAWKLAYLLTHSARDRLLDTYHDERSAVAKTLVNTTDRAFAFLSSVNWITRLVRLFVTPVLLQFVIQPLFTYSRKFRQIVFLRVSQLGITYRSSNIYDYGASAGNFHQTTPQPGDRFPYVIFSPCYYHLILFENQQLTKVNQFVEFIKKEYSNMIQIHDSNEEKIPLQFEGAILIRPDGYIAYRTNVFDIKHFQCYFDQFFLKEMI
ncbi:unnamed protein product [Rotaria sp. Silwood1]|nr:unnamed protein product [Rotaria sp. Silwood1]CAF3432379.1 unnamed protein product [Rotaria sp. Silwood1]CAF4524380.1 unnamed protein product [Rotaria sp. Silwood1]